MSHKKLYQMIFNTHEGLVLNKQEMNPSEWHQMYVNNIVQLSLYSISFLCYSQFSIIINSSWSK